MGKVIAFGDIHLCSKNYGAHVDYPNESLYYFENITDIAEESQATHIIGTGDFSYGRFHKLEYRLKVEELLHRQNKICNSNRFEVKGNHDVATSGMTEYEYYVERGLIKPSKYLVFDKVNITMVDYGKHDKIEILKEEGKMNIVIAHDFFKFNNTQLPNYGSAHILDNMECMLGVDYLICGHIHSVEAFDGIIEVGDRYHKTTVIYPGCMTRPAYREGFMPEACYVIEIDVDKPKVEFIRVPLWDLEKSFNIQEKNILKVGNDLDIKDIISRLDRYEGNAADIEGLIMSMTSVDMKYRKKAVELLKEGSMM
jgi:predicted phosphodiesterase